MEVLSVELPAYEPMPEYTVLELGARCIFGAPSPSMTERVRVGALRNLIDIVDSTEIPAGDAGQLKEIAAAFAQEAIGAALETVGRNA